MDATKARETALSNAKMPKDVMKMISTAAKKGLTFVRFSTKVRVLTAEEQTALELHGYGVKVFRGQMHDMSPTVYSISW